MKVHRSVEPGVCPIVWTGREQWAFKRWANEDPIHSSRVLRELLPEVTKGPIKWRQNHPQKLKMFPWKSQAKCPTKTMASIPPQSGNMTPKTLPRWANNLMMGAGRL